MAGGPGIAAAAQGAAGGAAPGGAGAGGLAAALGLSGWAAHPLVPAAAAFAIFVLALALYAALNPLVRPVILRSAVVGLPLGFLGIAGYLVLRRDVPQDDEWRVVQAVVAGGVVALGWIVTFAVQEYRRAEERSERGRDMLLALRQEIFAVLERLDETDILAEAAHTQERILAGEGERPYQPFSISQSPPTIYESVGDSIVLLPSGALETVIRFYAAYSDLTSIIEDAQSAAHANLSAPRRKALHERLTRQRRATFFWAVRALVEVHRNVRELRLEQVPLSARNRAIWQPIADVNAAAGVNAAVRLLNAERGAAGAGGRE